MLRAKDYESRCARFDPESWRKSLLTDKRPPDLHGPSFPPPARETRQRNLPQSVAGCESLLLSSPVNLLLLREPLVDLDEEISLVGDLGEGRYGC